MRMESLLKQIVEATSVAPMTKSWKRVIVHFDNLRMILATFWQRSGSGLIFRPQNTVSQSSSSPCLTSRCVSTPDILESTLATFVVGGDSPFVIGIVIVLLLISYYIQYLFSNINLSSWLPRRQ